MTDELRWLDKEEQAALAALNTVLTRLPPLLDARMQAAGELTHFEYLVLARLSELPERSMKISDLAAFAQGSLSRMSHLVKRLEQRGWVRRVTCADDGRATEAVLTDEGYAKVVTTAPLHLAAVRDLIIDPLTRTQLRQVTTIGRRLIANLTEN